MASWNPVTSSLAHYVASTSAADARKMTEHRCQKVLQHLYDSYNGYKACAEDCKEIALKILFQTVATTRFDFIGQMSSVIKTDFGLEPVTSESSLAAVHRSWIDVKAWFTDGREKAAIIAEICHAETHLIQEYEAALSDDEFLTDKVRQVLQEQLKIIRAQYVSVYDR